MLLCPTHRDNNKKNAFEKFLFKCVTRPDPVMIFNYLLEWETRQKSVLLFKSLSYPESPLLALLALLLLVLGEGDSTFIT